MPSVSKSGKAETTVALAAATFALYAWGVGVNPPYLYVDEVVFALQAHAIAGTGHDMNGRLLPLYFQMRPIADNSWFHPVLVYFTAPFVALLPFNEVIARLPSVLVGVIDVLLMYAVGKRVFQSERWAIVAAVLLALTPAHFIHARMAMDYLYPVPFVLMWLFFLMEFLDERRLSSLVAAGLALGVGFFSYIAAVVMMPIYVLMSWFALRTANLRRSAPYAVVAAAFAAPLVVLLFWMAAHSTVIAETLTRYGVNADPDSRLRFSDIGGRLSVYWSFLDPAFLFLSGGFGHMVSSTRRVGVFLAPMLVFIPLGLLQLASANRPPRLGLFVLGLFTAPLAACLLPEPYAIDRALVVLPFAILIATVGMKRALETNLPRGWRLAARALVLLIPLHFAFFVYDYWSDYPTRAAYRFQGNRRAALEDILARDASNPLPAVYLNSTRVPYIGAHWQFYLLKHRRPELAQRTMYFDSNSIDPRRLPPRTLLLTTTDDAPALEMVRAGALHQLAEFPEPGNPPLFMLLER